MIMYSSGGPISLEWIPFGIVDICIGQLDIDHDQGKLAGGGEGVGVGVRLVHFKQ
jgi:hypothetical protein